MSGGKGNFRWTLMVKGPGVVQLDLWEQNWLDSRGLGLLWFAVTFK
jgi:hypothetical protein